MPVVCPVNQATESNSFGHRSYNRKVWALNYLTLSLFQYGLPHLGHRSGNSSRLGIHLCKQRLHCSWVNFTSVILFPYIILYHYTDTLSISVSRNRPVFYLRYQAVPPPVYHLATTP
jgi:hypothetical protein